MRVSVLLAVAITALVAVSAPSFSMGGGGGGGASGGSGGSYTGGGSSTGNSNASDYSIALRMIRHEQYAEAISHLESALADKPNDADILNYLGFTHRMVGQSLTGTAQSDQFHLSLLYYQRALTIDANHKGVHEYLGELYLQMHDQASATKEMQMLATLCPAGCDERDALTKAMAAYVPATP